MYETITPSPLMGFFSNVNTAMGLKGHSHSCSVELEFRTYGARGWPSFEGTQRVLQERLKELTARPFKDSTNEDVARALWEGFRAMEFPEEVTRWGGDYKLVRLRLGVLGVPDAIGHASGFTYYLIDDLIDLER